ncbi:hypothetical protein D9M71_94060 [compost metagenome]
MEGAEVHLVQVELDVQLGQPIGDAGSELARGLVGEGDDQQRLGGYPLVGDEIDNALDQCEGFARPGPGDDEHRTIGGQNGFKLLWVGLGLEGGGIGSHSVLSSSPTTAFPMRLAIQLSRSLRRKRHVPPSLKAGSLPLAAKR